ncbi:DUF3800 domain-containing protein [Mesorhizobium sp. M0520]|uniref:DUF3800 domain-containing protein n=1 Tax=Mesorhizobium sp. M0520 TaxID=2956957 RepID=UPI00333503B3
MPVQAFVDDSGGKGQSRHFVLAGLIGQAEAWALFSEEWSACLASPPFIRTFKMRDAASCSGQFFGVTKPARDNKLRALARIINRYAEIVTWSVIDLEAHANTWGKAAVKPQRDPYFWPFHNTIMATCLTLWDAQWRERFEIIFDEQLVFGPRAKRWYPVMKEILKHREPEAATILPADPIFKTDDDSLPLQAADLWAWCLRRSTDDPSFKEFEWLLPEMTNVKQTDYSQYYDEDRMLNVIDQSREMLQQGLIPQGVSTIYAKIFNE